MCSPLKIKTPVPDFQGTTLFFDGKRVLDFDDSCSVSVLKNFVHASYLESKCVWLTSFGLESAPTVQRVWICRFDWDQDSFCIIHPHGKNLKCPEGVVLIDVDGQSVARIGLAWSFVDGQQVMLRCFFLGSDFSREANFPNNHEIFRFSALLDQSAKIVDPHFEGCRIPSYDKSSCKIGEWAPQGDFNYDIRQNCVISLENGESIPNNCQMAVFEQLKTAGYIAFANFERFCAECEMPGDLLQVPTSTLEMNPIHWKRFFAGAVYVVDCRVALEWQSDRAGRTRRVTLDLQCNTPTASTAQGTQDTSSAPCGPQVHNVSFGMTYCAGDSAAIKVSRRGRVLVDSAPEVDSGLHSSSADSRY